MSIALRPYQRAAVDAVRDAHQRGVLRPGIAMATGCHKIGQPVMLATGEVVPVELISIGDQLMGPDSQPRTVVDLIRGHGEMVRIVPVKGEAWIVNLDHILSLQRTGKTPNDPKAGSVLDVSVREYLTWPKSRKHLYKLFRTEAEFPASSEEFAIPPYDLGMILGDGTLATPGVVSVSKPDPEIEMACHELADRFGLTVRTVIGGPYRCPQYHFSQHPSMYRRGYRHGGNRLVEELKALRLLPIRSEHRFIPGPYKVASRTNRLALLAGLLDTDGHLGHSGFDFGTKSRQMADDIAFVARSVGLAAYISMRTTGPGAGQFRVSISGDLSIVPTRIPRKQSPARKQVKDVLRTGFAIEHLPDQEDFYGFTLDGDGRYLLGDFTVTHNSGKTIVFAKAIEETGVRALVIAHRRELIHQAAQKLGYVLPKSDIGIVMGNANQAWAPVVVASAQTIASPKRLQQLGRFDLVVIDEAHHAVSPSYLTTLRRLGVGTDPGMTTRALGVTATWDRADGIAMDRIFDEIVYSVDIETLIAAGFLVPIEAVAIETKVDLTGIATSNGDLSGEAVGRKIVESNYANVLAQAVAEHARYRVSLVFAPNIPSAEQYAERLNALGISAAVVTGETDPATRQRVIGQLSRGEIRAVVNVGVFTEGTDIPRVDCIVMGRPTKSRALYQQMAGRGLRTHPAKQSCLLIDLVNITRLPLQSAADLTGGEEQAGGKRVGKASLPGPGPEAVGELGATFALSSSKRSIIDRSRISWQQLEGDIFAASIGDGQVVLQPNQRNRDEYDVIRYGRGERAVIAERVDIGYAQGIAEGAITEAGAMGMVDKNARWRRSNAPATEKQIAALVRWKIPHEPGITKVEASNLLDAAIARANVRRRNWGGPDARAS
ncbi:MAG: DEAD/DEAH box helicase family protein [Thermomicrobiales bacterium]